jgi:hypothetical protein
MPQDSPGLKSQYAERLAADLATNQTEQEQFTSQIAVLQAELSALQVDHEMLLSMQQALGAPPSAAPTVTDGNTEAPVPSDTPPGTTGAEPATIPAARQPRKTRKRADTKKKAPAPTTPRAGARSTSSGQPTLRELAGDHLTEQTEPRSVAEITSTLQKTNPERTLSPTLVRNALENLVSRAQAERTKQGGSVYYSATTSQYAPETPAPVPAQA